MIGDADVVVGGDAQNITVIEERESAARAFGGIVVLQKGDHDGVQNGVEREKGHQKEDWGEIEPGFPLVLFVHN